MVAAGRGERFGEATPKQFLRLGGATLLELAVEALASTPGVFGVVAVLPADAMEGPRGRWARGLRGILDVVAGGATRAESVRHGLSAVGSAPFVLVHDAARPMATSSLAASVLEATRRHGAAVPAVGVLDTVKEDDGAGFCRQTLDRAVLRLAQTPQGARTDWLTEALDLARRRGIVVTDEAHALELGGRRVALVEGERRNVKITGPEDLEEANAWAEGAGGGDLRVGTGFDVHRFEASRPLVLGGVRFPDEPGLAGHSDADVVLHAAMDAFLGAAGLDDIGVWFPPEDPAFAGSDSRVLAREVAARVAAAGFEPVNLDLTLLAERPRIRDRRAEMRNAIADAFGTEPERIGLKATTAEGLGAVGRREGIACMAAALVRRSRRPGR